MSVVAAALRLSNLPPSELKCRYEAINRGILNNPGYFGTLKDNTDKIVAIVLAMVADLNPHHVAKQLPQKAIAWISKTKIGDEDRTPLIQLAVGLRYSTDLVEALCDTAAHWKQARDHATSQKNFLLKNELIQREKDKNQIK